jgi:hypothetical protein
VRVPVVFMLLTMGCGSETVLDLGDPGTSNRLLEGFHGIESGWRWTKGRFAVALERPRGAEREGARLTLHVFVADAVIARSGQTTLSCSVDGTTLAAETLTSAGSHLVVRDLPPLAGAAPTLRCTLSNPLPPDPTDGRERGIVVSKIRLRRLG